MAESNGRLVGRRMMLAVRGYVARSVAPIVTRLKEIEASVKAIKPERGEKGDRGERGESGTGLPGKDGAPGRDALELNILPAIDFTRSYPRGTFARNLNGLWRAFEDTSGERGWECIVAGLASFNIDMQEERKLVVSAMLSTGEKVEKIVSLEHPIDRGVYRAEEKYLKGDGVTWAGSWWIAQLDEPTDKPGDVPAGAPAGHKGQWRLAVKRGRDGKDSK